MPRRDQSPERPAPTHAAHTLRHRDAMPIPPPSAATPDDLALMPVERQVVAPLRPRHRSAWLGWVTASVLVAASGAHYVLVYRPLQRQLKQAETALLQQVAGNASEVAALRSDLAHTRAQLERAEATASIATATMRTAETPVEPAPATTSAARLKKSKLPHAVHARVHRARSKSTVDRAAAAAATRALNERTLQAHGTSDARSRAPAEPGLAHPLAGVLSDSNDPLQGL